MRGRPRLENPKRGRTLEERRIYMREFMRKKRAGFVVSRYVAVVDRTLATFDPRRDGVPEYESLTAAIMGDPPKGRSALAQREAGR